MAEREKKHRTSLRPRARSKRAAGLDVPPTTSAAQDRCRDPVAGLNAEFPRGAGYYFEHGPNRSPGGNDFLGFRLGVFCNRTDAAIALNEDHVQGYVGVLHP